MLYHTWRHIWQSWQSTVQLCPAMFDGKNCSTQELNVAGLGLSTPGCHLVLVNDWLCRQTQVVFLIRDIQLVTWFMGRAWAAMQSNASDCRRREIKATSLLDLAIYIKIGKKRSRGLCCCDCMETHTTHKQVPFADRPSNSPWYVHLMDRLSFVWVGL